MFSLVLYISSHPGFAFFCRNVFQQHKSQGCWPTCVCIPCMWEVSARSSQMQCRTQQAIAKYSVTDTGDQCCFGNSVILPTGFEKSAPPLSLQTCVIRIKDNILPKSALPSCTLQLPQDRELLTTRSCCLHVGKHQCILVIF